MWHHRSDSTRMPRRFGRRLLYVFVFFSIVAAITPHVLASYRIAGDSMQPTLQDGDRVLAAQTPLCDVIGGIRHGDVVIFKHGDRRFIKRVTGLPGDWVHVQNGANYVLQVGEYFVMGDNRPLSLDSRTFGPIKATAILGKMVLRITSEEDRTTP